jgi:hypothetical protein
VEYPQHGWAIGRIVADSRHAGRRVARPSSIPALELGRMDRGRLGARPQEGRSSDRDSRKDSLMGGDPAFRGSGPAVAGWGRSGP